MEVTRIEEIVSTGDDLQKGVRIYPNPTHGNVSLETIEVILQKIELLDLQGRVLLTREVSAPETRLSLSLYPEGIYLLRLFRYDGTMSVHKLMLRK